MRIRFRTLVPVALALAAMPATAQAGKGGDADLILTGGQIVTMDDKKPWAKALAVEDGKLTAVGAAHKVLKERGRNTKVVNLRGKTVIPGLQDSHIHFTPLGWELKNAAELMFAQSREDVLESVEAHIARINPQPGQWVIGKRWDEYKYEGGMVTRWQLDELAPNNPARLDRVYRGVAVNTKAFELMGIRDDDPSTWPDWWLEDPDDFTVEDKIFRERRTITTVDGQTRELEVPTGAFVGTRASALVTARPPALTFEDNVASIRDGADEMLRLGVTAIVDAATAGGTAFREADRRGWVRPLRVANMYEGIFFTDPPAAIGARLDERMAAGQFGGDRFLRMDGVKFYSDGGAGTRSAWMSEPFDRWWEIEGEPNFGVPVQPNNDARLAQFREAVKRGWGLHSHATGDRAIRQVTDLYMKLIDELRANDRDADPRWSIEHAVLPIEPATRTIDDMADYDIVASVQPWTFYLGASYLDNMGAERYARVNPLRSFKRAGVVAAGGSDYGVAHHNPWFGVYGFMTRKIMGTDYVGGPKERVGVMDALRTYTINGAYATKDDDIRGSLEKGKYADLVVLDIPSIHKLDANPDLALTMAERVLWTLVEGQTAFRSEQFTAGA